MALHPPVAWIEESLSAADCGQAPGNVTKGPGLQGHIDIHNISVDCGVSRSGFSWLLEILADSKGWWL